MKGKIILTYILSFLGALTLFLMVLLGSVIPYTSSPKRVLKELENQNYYERLASNIEQEMKLDILSSGLPTTVLEGIYNKEMIKEEIENSLKSTYQHQDYKINTSKVEENLKKNIEEYLAKNNIVITDEESLLNYVNDTVSTYASGINLYGYSKYIKEAIKKIKAPLTGIMIGLSLFEIIILFGIFKLCQEKHYEAICYTTAFFLFLVRSYFINHVDIKHLFLFNEIFSDTVKALINNILSSLTWMGIIIILLAILITFLKSQKMSNSVEF